MKNIAKKLACILIVCLSAIVIACASSKPKVEAYCGETNFWVTMAGLARSITPEMTDEERYKMICDRFESIGREYQYVYDCYYHFK